MNAIAVSNFTDVAPLEGSFGKGLPATGGLERPDASLRADLAAAILNKGYGPKPPLLASVLAAGFAERVVRALEGGGFLDLIAWTEHVCERYAPRRQIIAMLEAACTSARPVFRACADFSGCVDDLVTLEHTLARAIERYRQFDLRAADAGLEDLETAMAGFIIRLDATDTASAEHSRAVSLWCKRIARRLALDEDECIFAARSGLLHDVGKTMTPLDILQAPRGLTDAEWHVMREHTQLGAAMIREVPLLRPFTAAARWHHERLDGGGYPDGLPGKEIPLHVRIVTVADSFNAMIGRRPYRLPMSPSNALEQLIAHRGTQFDPMIVEAMIDVVERN